MSNESPFVIIQPEDVYPAPNYVSAIRAGNTLYVAGQIARDLDGQIIAPFDAVGQAEAIFENLGRILKAAGGDWNNVVKMNLYLVDRADSDAVSAIRLKALGDHRPPNTAVIVAALGSPEFKLEVELIAVLSS